MEPGSTPATDHDVAVLQGDQCTSFSGGGRRGQGWAGEHRRATAAPPHHPVPCGSRAHLSGAAPAAGLLVLGLRHL